VSLTPGIAALLALFAWWISTGAILWAVRWADQGGIERHQALVLFSVPALALGCAGVVMSLAHLTPIGVLGGFFSAILIWGWVESAFLSGILSGPEKQDCPPDRPIGERFTLAWGTVVHHEMALLLGLAFIVGASSGAENLTARGTYAVLWVARISAKLNLFLGVPRINTEFVPRPLDHLKSYFRQRTPTPFFAVSVTALTVAVAFFAFALARAEGGQALSLALLTALSALALLEHWLMVLPLPDAKLWRWMLPNPERSKTKGPADGL